MQCKELEAVLESEGLSPLPEEAREHLAGCANCQDLLADLSAIVVEAHKLPAEVNPPERIWISIRAQLEAEGVIRDVEPVVPRASLPWWSGVAELFRPRVLAGVGVGLLVVLGSIYRVEHGQPTKVAVAPQKGPVEANATTPGSMPSPLPVPPPKPASRIPVPQPAQIAGIHRVPQPSPSTRELKPSPSDDLYLGDSAAVLNETEGALPRRELSNNAQVDASLRKSLRIINGFISECEARLKQNPQDQLTREYLNMAYQQKADLLNAMMDSGRSEH